MGTAPANPPTTPFAGDVISVTAMAASGKVAFTASATNVVTELWVQPLRNANRKPSANGYRIKAYVAFEAGSLTTQITVPAGYYAAQCRFISGADAAPAARRKAA